MKTTADLERCYQTLGLRSDASLSETKSAFRRLALQYHPDRNKSLAAQAKFNAIAEAYSAILRSQGIDAGRPVHDINDAIVVEELGKLSFTILTEKEAAHSASAEQFEEEVRKRFNPTLATGTFCRIGHRWFEIESHGGVGSSLFHRHSSGGQSLIEWYKAADGTDRWKGISWDDFWSYVRKYASTAAV